MLSVEDQKEVEQFRKLNPEAGARDDGMSIDSFRAPQYAEGKMRQAGEKMQRDMDALAPQEEAVPAEQQESADALVSPLPEGTPAEWKETLRKLVGQLTEGSKESAPNIPEPEDTRETA